MYFKIKHCVSFLLFVVLVIIVFLMIKQTASSSVVITISFNEIYCYVAVWNGTLHRNGKDILNQFVHTFNAFTRRKIK